MKLFQTALIVSLFTSVNAWWGTGHLIVARIAYDILEKQAPQQLDKIEKLMTVLNKEDPDKTYKEGSHPFVECATSADAYKYHGGEYQKDWHFVNTPYLDEGGKISDFPEYENDIHNSTEAVASISKWLGNKSSNTYVKQQILTNSTSDEAGISLAIRLLIHYTGDIHQPLHSTDRVDHENEKGDFGGNTVYLPSHEGAKNLHAVWDSVVYEYTGFGDLPFTTSAWEANGKYAQTLMQKYPMYSTDDVKNLDPMVWAAESFLIGENFVYKGVTAEKALSADYVEQGNKLAEKQLVIGGTRLANLLMSINFDSVSGDLFLQ